MKLHMTESLQGHTHKKRTYSTDMQIIFSSPPRYEEKTKAHGATKTISPIKGDRRQLEVKRFELPKATLLLRNLLVECVVE